MQNPNVKWNDIIGLDAAKRTIKEAVVYPIKVNNFRVYSKQLERNGSFLTPSVSFVVSVTVYWNPFAMERFTSIRTARYAHAMSLSSRI